MKVTIKHYIEGEEANIELKQGYVLTFDIEIDKVKPKESLKFDKDSTFTYMFCNVNKK